MSDPAPRGHPEAPAGSVRAAVLAGLRGGVVAFAWTTAVAVGIGMIEYAVSGGLYRAWTWVKVGFLYVLSFCGVGLRAHVPVGATRDAIVWSYRFPLLVGTAGVLWFLAVVGGRLARRFAEDRAAVVAGCAGAVLGFAGPAFVISLPATLRFPDLLDATVSPVRWEAAVLPGVVAAAGLGAGVYRARRDDLAASGRGTLAVTWVDGGWWMFTTALGLAFVTFLALAAAKPGPTGAYAREMQAEGRLGALTVSHHVLMLPAQSVWVLAPSMGGTAEVSVGAGDRTTISIARADLGGGAALAVSRGPDDRRVPLGGGYLLFLLVPLLAVVGGGRRAAVGAAHPGARAARGAGAGVAFAALVTVGAWLSAASVPIPAFGLAPVSIRAAMPSTALLALAWGVAGGIVGALTAGWAPRGAATSAADHVPD